jgi:protein tyrosine phosphatase
MTPQGGGITLANFDSYIQYLKRVKDGNDGFERQFSEIVSYQQEFIRHPTTESSKPENKDKNRHGEVLPYDYNRVKLFASSEQPQSDYINASKITPVSPVPERILEEERILVSDRYEYIAAQGPSNETLDDFLRMIFEQHVNLIVMLCSRADIGTSCVRYWPRKVTDEPITTNNFKVSLISEFSIRTDSTVARRELRITRMKPAADGFGSQRTLEARRVVHLHCLQWNDKALPMHYRGLHRVADTSVVLDLVHEVHKERDDQNPYSTFSSTPSQSASLPPPILVHCSAGIGRTGCFLLVDLVVCALEAGVERVHPVAMLKRLREQRAHLVQTREQWIYVNKCVRDAIHRLCFPQAPLDQRVSIIDNLYEAITHQSRV